MLVSQIISNVKKCYFQYSLYFLITSLFLGNAFLSIASVIFYLSLIPVFFRNNKNKFSELIFIKPFLFLGLFFFVCFAILCFTSKNLAEILVIEKHLPLILFPIILYYHKQKINRILSMSIRKVLIYSALFTFAISFIYGLWRMFFFEKNINSIYITYNFLSDLFGVHQIYLSVLYLLAILFSIDFYLEKKQLRLKNIYLFISSVLFIAIILLSSRSAIFISFILIFLNLLLKRKISFNYTIKLILFMSILGSILTFSIPTLKKRTVNFNKNVSSYSGLSFRFKLWNNAFEVYRKSPIYGFGYGKSQEELLKQYKKVNFRRAYLRNLNAHNQYIQSLIDNGIIGFIILILILTTPFFYSKKEDNIILFSILIIFTLIFESFLNRQNGIIFYSLFISIFLIENEKIKDIDKIHDL